jgi:hypothetical protein
MRIKGELEQETVEEMVRECLARKFGPMRVAEIHVPYISGRVTFELHDEPETVVEAAVSPLEPRS